LIFEKITKGNDMKTKNFIITGEIVVSGRSVKAADDEIVGFRQKDKSLVKLIAALEVENPDGTYRYLSLDAEMQSLGFQIISYDRTDFINPSPRIENNEGSSSQLIKEIDRDTYLQATKAMKPVKKNNPDDKIKR